MRGSVLFIILARIHSSGLILSYNGFQDPDTRSIIECLLGLKRGIQYSESVRLFVLNLRYLSPRCYEHVRSKFQNNLPHISTIRKWFQHSSTNGEPGICNASISTLESLVKKSEAKGEKVYCTISYDEMAIREHVQWIDAKKRFLGYINYGTVSNSTEFLPLA